jgi:beta-lactamase regulating signal transducer with metallopeptidase domain
MFDAQLIDRIGWTLIHSVWQLALIACFASVCGRVLFRDSARLRYSAGCTALLAMVAVSVTTFLIVSPGPRPSDAATMNDASNSVPMELDDFLINSVDDIELRTEMGHREDVIGGQVSASPITPKIDGDRVRISPVTSEAEQTVAAQLTRDAFSNSLHTLLPTFVGLWLVGVGLLALRPFVGLYTVWRIRHVGRLNASNEIVQIVADLCDRMGLRRVVEVAHSAIVEVPSVVGTLRPLLLLPATAITGLSDLQLKAIIAHELAHVRRFDFLANFVQTLVETVFFFHPAVWWMSRQVRDERENCCDDIAIAICGDRASYVKSLVVMDDLRNKSPQPVVAANGGTLVKRIRRIAGKERPSSNRSWLVGAVVLLVAATGLWGFHVQRGDALAQESKNAASSNSSDWKAKATIKVDDRTFLLGENLHVQFGITNTQDESVKIETGGDYRGGPRPSRFKVVAFDANGKRVDDPYKDHLIRRMGGFSQTFRIAPKKTEWLHVPVTRYCEFKKAGTYTLRIYHDLGWDGKYFDRLQSAELPEGKHNSPIAEAKITLTSPSPVQASALVDRMASSLRAHHSDASYWKEGVDFASLRQPVYFPLLRKLTLDRDESVAKAARRTLHEFKGQGRIDQLHFTADAAKQLFKELKPAWSGEKLGVQFGVSHASEQRQFQIGKRIPLTTFVRNVSDKPLNVRLYADFFWFAPTLVNRQNDAVKLEKFYINGVVRDLSHHYTLQPGEAFGVRHPGVGLGIRTKQTGPNAVFSGFPYWKQAVGGKYTLTQIHQLIVSAVGDAKDAPRNAAKGQTARFTSGAIDVEIIPPDPPKHAPGTGGVVGEIKVQAPFPKLPLLRIHPRGQKLSVVVQRAKTDAAAVLEKAVDENPDSTDKAKGGSKPNSKDRNKKESAKYKPGYDPTKAKRDGVGVLPKQAWGKPVNGIQAAISAPRALRLSELVTVYLVLRNVSAKTIRLSLPQHPDILSISRDGTTISYSVNKPAGYTTRMTFWKLEPSHQILVPSPVIQVLANGDLGLNRALTSLTPGPHTLYARIGAGGTRTVTNAEGKRSEFVVPPGDWKGWVSPARLPIEIVSQKAPFSIGQLKDIPKNHGLKPIIGATPPTLNEGATEWIRLRYGLNFALDSSKDAHWLRDFSSYNRIVYWGPIPAARLEELELLEKIKKLSKDYIQTASHDSQIEHRVAVLVKSAKPLAKIGLEFASTMPAPKLKRRFPSDYVVRTIRDRRVELEKMGLGVPTQRALTILTANDPAMPDDSQFKIVASRLLPKELKKEAWGPINAGLQAAALMPEEIESGSTSSVRLFIRNVSDHDIRIAVSERSGYDYATATDQQGKPLNSVRPMVYPMGFSGAIYPELNPGQVTSSPPVATLQKVLLKPGAVWEVSTKTSLGFNTKQAAQHTFGSSPNNKNAAAVTTIAGKPTTAKVTWHLHTANGAIHNKDLTKRTWPAKGSWVGILRTAATPITLSP